MRTVRANAPAFIQKYQGGQGQAGLKLANLSFMEREITLNL
jgi:hypothetical protein